MTRTIEKKLGSDLLAYLQKIQGYPYDPKIDTEFAEEIIVDFSGALDILDEIKAFRWYHADRATTSFRTARSSLRRWLNNAKNPARYRAAPTGHTR
jgi:hypothetical protein